jgi:signal transduction histidine kinase
LPELSETLDFLRERLTRLDRVWGEDASAGRPGAATPGDADPWALLQDILSISPSSEDPGTLFSLAVDRAVRLCVADRAMLFVALPGGGRLVPRSAYGFRRQDLEAVSIQPGEGIVGRVITERRVLTYTGGSEGEARDGFIERFPVRGAIAVPIRVDGEAGGVLFVGRRGLDTPFSANDVLLLVVVADRVGEGLAHQALLDRRRGAIEPARGTAGRLAEIEKARVLGEMAGGLARELSNIFAIILGKSRLLLARAHDEPLRESLGLLEEAAWRGADVVHRLTGLAVPPLGEEVGAVDMAALVEETLASARPRWKDEPEGRGATIDLVTDLGSAPPVRANASALRDTVVNLVQNAVDAMPRGGRLSVVTRPHEGGVEVVLEDTGEGIPEDACRRAFDPFFTTRSPQRMGLGLTVAHGVVTRYGGRIGISARPGGGTRVTIWLPGAEMAVLPELASAFPPPSMDAGEAVPLASPGEVASILVLEHESAIRSLLVDALGEAGYKVETAVDGLSGLGKIESGQWDVVLADLALPERSGLAIARAVRSLHPHTPVVLIT